MLARSVAWIEEEETIVQALPIIVTPVAGIVLVTLLYVTMMFDHELVKVTSEDHCMISIAGYYTHYTLILGNLSPGVMYQWIMCWMSWPGDIDSLIRSKDPNMWGLCSAVCRGRHWLARPLLLDQMLEWAACESHSHSNVEKYSTGHLHLMRMTKAMEA